MTDLPVFPKEFLQHCPKVKDAKRLVDADSAEDFAECSFTRQGAGMSCDACSLWMTRPYLDHKLDREWLPKIEQYYRNVEEYEEAEKERQVQLMSCGSGI